MTRQFLINGRFLEGARTGVNAVAHALTDTLCAAPGSWDVQVVVPPMLRETAKQLRWPTRVLGQRGGILWEQLDLPKARTEGVIAGFFNTVPLRGDGYVTMLHDAHVFSTPKSYSRPIRHWRQTLSRRAGTTGNFILTVSEHSKTDLITRGIGKERQINVVPNGPGLVVRAKPEPAILQKLGLGQKQPYCLALANSQPHKNIPLLLRAFGEPDLRDIHLVLFGKEDRNTFKAAGHNVPSNIRFAGQVSDAELAALYRDAIAVCLPSTAEGFGLPALEAMALGTPVVHAACGALPEVTGGAGVALPPDDPRAWADAIRRLASDVMLRKRLGKAGRARAEHFTWQAAGKTLLGHLDQWFPK